MAQKTHSSFADDDELKNFTDLSGQFLLAMPNVDSGVFSGSVVYLFEHSPDGASGVIINRVTDIELSELAERFELNVADDLTQQWVFFGGPLQATQAFLLRRASEVEDAESGAEDMLVFNNSRDALQSYLLGEGPKDVFICFGYAGWDGGQLEDELQQNVWLTINADLDIIFDCPVHDRYRVILATLGIEPSSLSSQIGHA